LEECMSEICRTGEEILGKKKEIKNEFYQSLSMLECDFLYPGDSDDSDDYGSEFGSDCDTDLEEYLKSAPDPSPDPSPGPSPDPSPDPV